MREEATTRPRLVTLPFVTVTVATFAYFTGLGATLPVVPQFIEDDLGGGGIAVGVGVGAMAVSAALLRPWVGRLGDVRGRKILVVSGAFVVGASIAGYHLATSLETLIAFRLVTGVGEAAMFVGAATIVQDLAPDDRRGEAASYFSVALYGGLAIGPAIGDALFRASGAGTVWTASAAALFVAAALGLLVPADRPAPGITIAERTHFLHRAALGPGLVLFCGLLGLTAFTAFLPLYVDEVPGVASSGPFFALYGGLILVVRIVGATVPDRFGSRPTATAALVAIGVGMVLFSAWAAPSALWAGTATFSSGMALLFPALFVLVVNAVPERERSHAVGTFSLFFDLSQGLGALLLGLVVAGTSERGAFVVAAASSAVGVIVLRRVGGRRDTPPP